MTGKDLYRVFGAIDEELLERSELAGPSKKAAPLRAAGEKMSPSRRPQPLFRRYGYLAALLAVAIAVGAFAVDSGILPVRMSGGGMKGAGVSSDEGLYTEDSAAPESAEQPGDRAAGNDADFKAKDENTLNASSASGECSTEDLSEVSEDLLQEELEFDGRVYRLVEDDSGLVAGPAAEGRLDGRSIYTVDAYDIDEMIAIFGEDGWSFFSAEPAEY